MLQQLAEQPQEALTIRRGQPLPQDQKLAVAYRRGGRVSHKGRFAEKQCSDFPPYGIVWGVKAPQPKGGKSCFARPVSTNGGKPSCSIWRICASHKLPCWRCGASAWCWPARVP